MTAVTKRSWEFRLRWLLVAGAMSVIRHGRKTNFEKNPWPGDLMHRKPTKVAAVALASKIARTAWAVLANGETYRQPVPAEAYSGEGNVIGKVNVR